MLPHLLLFFSNSYYNVDDSLIAFQTLENKTELENSFKAKMETSEYLNSVLLFTLHYLLNNSL